MSVASTGVYQCTCGESTLMPLSSGKAQGRFGLL